MARSDSSYCDHQRPILTTTVWGRNVVTLYDSHEREMTVRSQVGFRPQEQSMKRKAAMKSTPAKAMSFHEKRAKGKCK